MLRDGDSLLRVDEWHRHHGRLAPTPLALDVEHRPLLGELHRDRKVKARQDRSLEECITEWSELLQDSDDLFASQLAAVAVSDVLAHEQDIRTGLNRPGARDDENIIPAVEMGLSFVEQGAQSANLPALRLVTEDVDRKIGQGEPVAILRTTTFELFRALHGRRTVEQVRAMEWEGDPGPWLPVLSVFPRTEHVVEE